MIKIFTVNFWLFMIGSIYGQSFSSEKAENSTQFQEFQLPNYLTTQSEYEFGVTFSKNYDTVYWGVRLNEDWEAEIRYSVLENGKWCNPGRLIDNNIYTYNDPWLDRTGKRLYFVSNQPASQQGEPKDFDIWYVEKLSNGWSEPINAGSVLNSDKDEFYVSINNERTLYCVSNRHTFGEADKWDFDIYYSEFVAGNYTIPIRLDSTINSTYFECDPFIAGDNSFIIFCSSKPGGYGEGDLYISFNENGNWTKPKNMGPKINSDLHEFCPQASKDGKYFFYTSGGDVKWAELSFFLNRR
jgi:hypothetical protein